MPFINSKLTVKVDDAKRNSLKSEFGKAISNLGKPESYLMINIEDGCDLYLGGKKLDKGAYVSVQVFGRLAAPQTEKMTGAICDILKNELDIPGDAVYVTYQGIENWGWNGGNF
ncbi:MAG: hypothetical protein II461_04055 [Treponema sp.]|nr:hypothetical protein [Treponema sp.]